jgi:hypothetical protein
VDDTKSARFWHCRRWTIGKCIAVIVLEIKVDCYAIVAYMENVTGFTSQELLTPTKVTILYAATTPRQRCFSEAITTISCSPFCSGVLTSNMVDLLVAGY